MRLIILFIVEYKNINFTVWDVGGQDKVFRTLCVMHVFCELFFPQQPYFSLSPSSHHYSHYYYNNLMYLL